MIQISIWDFTLTKSNIVGRLQHLSFQRLLEEEVNLIPKANNNTGTFRLVHIGDPRLDIL